MREVELAGARALGAPFEIVSAVRRELHDARVAVAIAHIEGTISQHGHIGRQIEVGAVIARLPALAKGKEEPAFAVEFEDLLPTDIGEPEVVLVIHRQAVGHDELVGSPRGEEFAGAAVQPADGGLRDGLRRKRRTPCAAAAMEHPDVILRVHANADALAEHVTVGEFGPVCDRFALCCRCCGAGHLRGSGL